MIGIVGFRHAVDVGECVAIVAQTAGDQVGAVSHDLARKHLTRFDQNQLFELVLRHFQVAAQLDAAHRIAVAFGDIDGNEHAFLVRRQRHLRRIYIHVDVATVQVPGAQSLQVAGKFFAGVLVIVLEKRQPVAGLELKLISQLFIGEHGVADHVDVLDRRHRAFVDGDFQGDAITWCRQRLGIDRGTVAALGDILALQFIAHALQRGALEYLAFTEPRLLEPLHQVVGADDLVADNLDTGDRGAFDYIDHQHIAIACNVDVLKETGLEQ